jgi:hypothetical protein
MPAAFDGSNVACIKILLDLISVLIQNLDCGSVMAFVNVLVNVLYCLDRRTDLDIDVTVVSVIACPSIFKKSYSKEISYFAAK